MKILAIDDNKSNLTALKAVVQDVLPTCVVVTALSGSQGIELAQTEDPDVILLDIVMPGMDGFEVCRRLKADERLSSIPVVFLTALQTNRENRVKALEAGAEGFISKPLDDQELAVQVRAMAKVKVANRLQRMEKEELAALVAERTSELEHELALRRRAEERDRMACEVLSRLNHSGSLLDMVRDVLATMGRRTDVETVGLHLRKGGDFLYDVRSGFTEDFLKHEDTMVGRAKDGGISRNNDGSICMEGFCGLVLSGNTDPANPLFTEGGSFWTNNALSLPDLSADRDPRPNPRNCGIPAGSLSVALIPLREDGQVLGLLQLCDRRPGRFTLELLRFMEHLATSIAITLKRREENEEKTRLQVQLVQAQKMESIGRLAGGVAHDFNNMLQAILGHAEFALEKCGANEDLKADIHEIQKSGRRSADLTHQLLAFARKQPVVPGVMDLNDAISGILKMLARLLGEDIHLVWAPDAALGMIRMDPSQIDQILANLAVNARDAVDRVGTLTIETQNVTLDADYCATHTDAVPGEYVMLTVSDDGCGMDNETLEKIFDPFFTTKDVGKGTGLGLSTVYGIVRQNNGSISVCSQPGKGATFKLYLPRLGSATEAPPTADKTLGEAPHGVETILLAEDEESVRLVIRRFLENLGYTILVAGEAESALRLAVEHPGEIHLVISNVIMPGMNGYDLVQRLSTLRPAIKRLFVSGFPADVIAKQGIVADGVYFLHKPFTRDDLARRVRQVLDT